MDTGVQEHQTAALRNSIVDAVIREYDSKALIDRGMGSGNCSIAVVSAIQTKRIATELLPSGISSSSANILLCASARLAGIVVLNSDTDLVFCEQSRQKRKLWLLSLQESDVFFESMTKGWNGACLKEEGTDTFLLQPYLAGKAVQRLEIAAKETSVEARAISRLVQ